MKVIIFGGHGFVGARVAHALQQAKCEVSCVSRSGKMPEQLVGDHWALQVNWLRGDAGNPNISRLAQHDVLISTVGAPPIPTFTKRSYQRSLHTNGEVNRVVIEAAGKAGIKRVVLLGAQIPKILQGEWFAYTKGKQIAAQAAKTFSERSEQHSAVVIQPGGIYGKRHTRAGREIPIDWIMAPMAKVLPSQLISVDRVAQCVAEAALGRRANHHQFSLITHREI